MHAARVRADASNMACREEVKSWGGIKDATGSGMCLGQGLGIAGGKSRRLGQATPALGGDTGTAQLCRLPVATKKVLCCLDVLCGGVDVGEAHSHPGQLL